MVCYKHHSPIIVRINQLRNRRLHRGDSKPDTFHRVTHQFTLDYPLPAAAGSQYT